MIQNEERPNDLRHLKYPYTVFTYDIKMSGPLLFFFFFVLCQQIFQIVGEKFCAIKKLSLRSKK